ncbi:adenylate/guanylate cyclase domain-containing protein [Portibacter marinus]|uniref:adenylate/guanylate cyclase domain-containing protein n=1 Tax=Portibacter marinus TaxID=2898660 RepID=UPI001F48904E|nr:adenylate/guanylate cyclase domain-containing protein [Portibacter marinus]
MGKRLLKLLNSLVLYFVPEAHNMDNLALRASRIRISVYLIGTIAWLLFVSVNYVHFESMVFVNLVSASLSLLAAFLNKFGYSKSVSAHVFLLGNTIGIATNAMFSGALTSTIEGLLLIPAIAMLIGTRRTAWIWLLICIVFITVVYFLLESGYEIHNYISDENMNNYLFTGVLGMLVALYFCLLVFRNERVLAYDELKDVNVKLDEERNRSESLLLNILPQEVAQELKDKGSAKAQYYDDVTVLFTDFKDFTKITEDMAPQELLDTINTCFIAFDEIISKYNIEKIKTIGDSYMCVGGLPIPNEQHAQDIVSSAIEIRDFMDSYNAKRRDEGKIPFLIRIGIHSGSVVAGIVGIKKYAYDIWGNTVNLASRIESTGIIGMVNISSSTYELIKDDFECQKRGVINVKGKGEMTTYSVISKNHEPQ